MADVHQELDKIAELIAEKSNEAVSEVVKSLMELVDGKTPEESLEILSGLNMEFVMGTKLAVAFASFESGVLLSLRSTYTSVVLPEKTLRILLETAKKKLRTELTSKLSDNMMQSIIDGISTNSSVEDVINAIGEATPDLATLVNTTYNQFSNTITNMMIEKLPDNTKMVYIGANDALTRKECKEKINFSPATKKKVLSKFKNFNNELWNCRHKWEEMGRDKESQGFEAEASE